MNNNKNSNEHKRKSRTIKKEKYTKQKKEIPKVLFLIISMTTVFYLGLIGIQNLGGLKVFYSMAYREVAIQEKNMTGFIIREEVVQKAPENGTLHIIKDEGVSVVKGIPISAILSEDDIERQKNNINVVEIEEFVPPSLITEENTIEENNKDISLATILSRNNDNIDETIPEPKVQYSYTLNKLETSNERSFSAYMTSTQSGVLSFLIDGFELDFSKDKISNMTIDEFNSLNEQISLSYAKPKDKVSAGEDVLKIISNETWGIVTFLDEKDTGIYEEGDSVKITFTYPEQIVVDMNVLYKETRDGVSKIVFGTNDYLSRVLPFRKVEFQIGDPIREGFSVPVEALTERVVIEIPNEYIERERNRLIVYRCNEKVESVAIEFLYKKINELSGREMALIRYNLLDENRIKEGDVLINTKNNENFSIRTTEVETGVFVVNGKIAEFKKVTPILYKHDQVVVSEELSEIKELDRVICNPKHFGDGDLLTNLELVEYRYK